ncbi:response regulator [Siphonobacter sp. SORGH_AS_0500]|uniref:response regulator n=1 Tax=Siphonobacter sp. SORGH_AS_0500 TaxID=1864824 RepID=UPI002854F89B|nr:response regulator [Siphonobacter sp. SORGH_AS_0500]MDR6193681.1 CheY-like chemotaxis protein [Siphonobacter sp. SORGH_AS_0500]
MDYEKLLILVVEDNQKYEYLLSKGYELGNYDCQYHFVNTSDEVLGLLENGQIAINIILIDDDSPGLNGLQVIEILKNSHWKALPVVLFSGKHNKDIVQQAYEKGANAFIIKPNEQDSVAKLWETSYSFWKRHVSLPDTDMIG